jgi:hypothetical protein
MAYDTDHAPSLTADVPLFLSDSGGSVNHIRTREEAEMVRVVSVDRDELMKRRDEILTKQGLSLAQFAARAAQYTLVGSEWDAWEELRSIAFLLGDE